MTTALATVQPQSVVRANPFEPESIEDALKLSEMLARSALVPSAVRGKPADIFIILATARELGIGPMQGLSDINVIQGKPVYSADLMVAQCKRRGDVCRYIRLVESTDQKATYETHRVGAPAPETFTFTLEDAKKLQLLEKDNYRKQPKTMLRRRAAAALAREVYPDLVRGYDPDEVEEIQAQPAAVQAVPAEQTAAPATKTAEAIKDKVAAKLNPAHAERVRAILDEAKASGVSKDGMELLVVKALGTNKPNRLWTSEDMDKIHATMKAEFYPASPPEELPAEAELEDRGADQ